MSPTPDDVATTPTGAAPAEPEKTDATGVVPSPAPVDQASQVEPAPSAGSGTTAAAPVRQESAAVEVDEREPPPGNVLLYTIFGLLCTGVALWLVFAWMGYKEKYSQQTEGWHLGGTKMVEITLIRDDKKNLSCASDRFFGDVHCGYHRDSRPFDTSPENDPHVLQPFNTVKNELFLAAGLWQSPILAGALPADRFTVVCNYHIIGVLKAVALRWSPTGNFGQVDQSVAVGTVSDCVIPQ